MSKIDHFRKINLTRPDIVEHLIPLWGSANFGNYVADLLHSGNQSKATLSQDILLAISALIAEHRREYPQFDVLSQVKPVSGLEQKEGFQLVNAQFPLVAERVKDTWGSREFGEYLTGLFSEMRAGKRHGFPPEILMALFKIKEEHDHEYPQVAVTIRDIWSFGAPGH